MSEATIKPDKLAVLEKLGAKIEKQQPTNKIVEPVLAEVAAAHKVERQAVEFLEKVARPARALIEHAQSETTKVKARKSKSEIKPSLTLVPVSKESKKVFGIVKQLVPADLKLVKTTAKGSSPEIKKPIDAIEPKKPEVAGVSKIIEVAEDSAEPEIKPIEITLDTSIFATNEHQIETMTIETEIIPEIPTEIFVGSKLTDEIIEAELIQDEYAETVVAQEVFEQTDQVVFDEVIAPIEAVELPAETIAFATILEAARQPETPQKNTEAALVDSSKEIVLLPRISLQVTAKIMELPQEEREAVNLLLADVIELIDNVAQLRFEGSEKAPEAEEDLARLCAKLFETLGIVYEPDEILQFAYSIMSVNNQIVFVPKTVEVEPDTDMVDSKTGDQDSDDQQMLERPIELILGFFTLRQSGVPQAA